MDVLTDWVLDAAGTPWALLAVFAFTVVDSLFPPVPSESLAIGLAAIGIATGAPPVWMVAVVAAAGAFVGDNLAYQVGRWIGADRFRWMHRSWFAKPMRKAAAALDRRVSTAILAGRFIPVGRIGINLVAGISGVPGRVFRPLAALASVIWAVYSVVLGAVAGAWFARNPILGVVLAIGVGLAFGLLLDRAILLYRRRRGRSSFTGSADVPRVDPTARHDHRMAADAGSEPGHETPSAGSGQQVVAVRGRR